MSQLTNSNISEIDEEEECNLKINLIDFDNLEKSDHDLIHHLKNKMRNFKSTIPFAMKFIETRKIQPKDHHLSFPSDVKISHSQNCICVADDSNREIKFFDLTSFEYLAAFPLYARLLGILIEENFDNQQNDAIYFRHSNCLMKFKVKDILQYKGKAECIWKIESNHIYGMACRKIGINTQIFIFNANTKLMDVIDAKSGKIIIELQLENLDRIVDITFIKQDRLIVADIDHDECYIYDEINPNEWKLIRTIDKVNNVGLHQPLGLAIDRIGEKVILSDYENKRIIVLDIDGNLIHEHVNGTVYLNPFGMDFDDRSGLLFIADQQDHSIRIFE